jgi:hypothetical protein
MSKKLFKRLMATKTAELRKWASRYNLTFKTTSEIERENAEREKEQKRLERERGRAEDNGRHGGGRGKRNFKTQRNA